MCGINGIFYFKNVITEEEVHSKINTMNNSIIHRGPDAEGIYIKNNLGLGFRRLSIIDLSKNANQPMHNSNKSIVIVFNGEIYNYIEIYNELIIKGYEFITKSDTEVIINSYLEWGVDCVNKFNGMWAFAIYDQTKNLFFASRDRSGVKPFYYSLNQNYFIFSSETKAIVASEKNTLANKTKAYEYLAYGYNKTNDGETFYNQINELLPGTTITIENNKVKFHKYWELKSNMNYFISKDDAFHQFTNLFENALQIRFRSDVPIAFLLSGGLDSSVIASTTENLITKGILPQNKIQAYTVHFPNYVNDELEITQSFVKTCQHIHLNVFTPDIQTITNNLEQLMFDFDQPVGSFSHIIHNAMMQEIHKDGIKVALNGQGADEAFYGYDKYIFGYFLLDKLVKGDGDFIEQLQAVHQHLGYSYNMIANQMFKALLSKKNASYFRAKFSEKNISCLNSDFVKKAYNHYKYDYTFSLKGNNLINYTLEQISNSGLNSILHYEDVSSMRSSIEMRSPFMDYRLMEFAFSIPDDLKFDKGTTKKVIRETLGKKLPNNIVNNYKKIGFQSPFLEYMKDPSFNALIQDTLNSKSFNEKTIWNKKIIRERFQNPEKYPHFPFWRFLNFELWSKANSISNL
jgi:asparagine synthase (glutamine-hydrolysing)